MLYLGTIIFTAAVLIQFRRVYMQYQIQFKAPSQTETEARIRELRQLRDGWCDGFGTRYQEEGLDWLQAFTEYLFAAGIPMPYLYPIDDQKVSAEWDTAEEEIVMEIALPDRTALLYLFEEAVTEQRFDLDDRASRKELLALLRDVLATKV